MTTRRGVPAVLLTVAALLAACSGNGTLAARSTPTGTGATSASPAPTGSAPGSGSPSRPPGPPVAALSWHDCDGGFQCATLTTRLDDAHPDKGTVGIAVVRKRASGPGSRIGSLVINPGGPGESAVGFLERDVSGIPAAIRARFDLVAFDPRGVGRTAAVRCGTTGELDRYFAVDPNPDDPSELAGYESANKAFAAGCQRISARVLPEVATSVVADDLDRVRAGIGDPKLTYLGYSYGTAIGAAYLDRYPTHLRAMVLDGALDPTLTWDQLLRGQAGGFDGALAAFLADCQQHSCAFRKAVSGDLGQAFDALARQVDTSAMSTHLGRSLGPAEFTFGVGAGLYSRSTGWPDIATGLANAEQGDGTVLLELSDSYLERDHNGYSNASEANAAVNCLDRPWPHDPAAFTRLADSVRASAPRFGPGIALSGMTCAYWPVAPVGRPHVVRGTGAPAVVVIGGTRDPATPYAWAKGLAGQLDRAVLLTHVGDGHTVYRTGGPSCITGPVDSYLLTAVAPATGSC